MRDTLDLGQLQSIATTSPTPSTAQDTGSPLLSTKLRVPECTPTLLSRSRLITELSRGPAGAVTLLSAPAGFGKTTLVADWVRRQDGPVAWLALDEHDNDPVLFWRYLIAALQTVNPQLGQRSQAVLASQLGTSLETVVTLLVNDIVSVVEPGRTLILVLDDFYWIRNATIHKSINYLLQHQPQQLHVMLLTRADPTLPLARLRVEGRLQELRVAELRLTPEETASYLEQFVPQMIAPSALEILIQQTDGWVAGIQLAGLSLRQVDAVHTERLVRTLAGAKHHIFAFLLEEVLSHQSPEVRQFLLETATLNRFCSRLCAAVTGYADSGPLLRQLVADSLFISQQDDEGIWYRYHPLFAEMLRSNLDDDTRRNCLRRAAEWYAQEQLLQDAVHCAIEAQDYVLVADTLTRTYKHILAQGLLVSLQKWLAILPEEHLSPRLRLAGAWCRVYEIGEQEVEDIVTTIRSMKPDLEPAFQGEILAVQAIYASLYGSSAHSLDLATQAIALIHPQDYLSLAAAYQALGNASRNLGDLDKAIGAYRDATRHFESMGSPFMAQLPLYRIADMQVQQGRLHQALQTYQDVRQKAQVAGQEPVIATGLLYGHLSELYREWNDLDQALAYAEQELELARAGHMLLAQIDGYLELAATTAAMDDVVAAREALNQARQAAELLESVPVCAQVAMQEARHELFYGDLGAAAGWAEDYDARRGSGESALTPLHAHTADVLLARIRLRQGRNSEALALLEQVAAACNLSGRIRLLTEVYVLEAMAHAALDNSEQAQQAIVRALTLAWQEGYVRVFVENGQRLAPLLAVARHLFPDYVNQLLKLLSAGTTRDDPYSGLLDPLTPRELEILKLIGQGKTNGQIAGSLFITVGTVKGHINHIFSKLDVTNRTQALVRARELELMDI